MRFNLECNIAKNSLLRKYDTESEHEEDFESVKTWLH